jgi:hypothetical protein
LAPPPPFLTATTDGSLKTIPLPFTYTRVLAVPRSMAKSLENRPKMGSRSIVFFALLEKVPAIRIIIQKEFYYQSQNGRGSNLLERDTLRLEEVCVFSFKYQFDISGFQVFEICRGILETHLHLKFTDVNHHLINHSIFPGLFLGHTNLTRAIIGIPTLRKGIRLRLKHKVFWKLRPYH